MALTDQFRRHLDRVGGLLDIVLFVHVSVAGQYFEVSRLDGAVLYLLRGDLDLGRWVALSSHDFVLLDSHGLEVLLILLDEELLFFPEVRIARFLLDGFYLVLHVLLEEFSRHAGLVEHLDHLLSVFLCRYLGRSCPHI